MMMTTFSHILISEFPDGRDALLYCPNGITRYTNSLKNGNGMSHQKFKKLISVVGINHFPYSSLDICGEKLYKRKRFCQRASFANRWGHSIFYNKHLQSSSILGVMIYFKIALSVQKGLFELLLIYESVRLHH